MTKGGKSEGVTTTKKDFGRAQSRELAGLMDHWLELFDRYLADQEAPLSQRPLRALMMLFREGAIDVRAGEKRLHDPDNPSQSIEKLWFRILFDAVEYWYVKLYGEVAMESRGTAPLIGAQMIRSVPFSISVPANRMVLEEKGELAWMYFEDGLGEGEDATSWIVDGPDLSRLSEEARTTVVAETIRTAEVLREIEFRRVTFRSNNDQEVQNLIQSTLTYLSQAASRMVSGRQSETGPAWFDLQMANEAALKAVIRSNTGKQQHTHSLKKELLVEAQRYGVVFDSDQLSIWPCFSDLSDWRYGQGNPQGIAKFYSAYRLSLELVSACMAAIEPGLTSGTGVLIRYAPWRTKNALGEYRS